MSVIPDRRHWILDPPLHRFGEQMNVRDLSGLEVETVLGTMVLIDLTPEGADLANWVCDLCSEPILTAWGEESFPVPMFGGHALCLNHYNEMSQPIDPLGLDHLIGQFNIDQHYLRSLPAEEIAFHPEYESREGYGLGPWPLRFCSCPFCQATMNEWSSSFRNVLKQDPRFQNDLVRNDPSQS